MQPVLPTQSYRSIKSSWPSGRVVLSPLNKVVLILMMIKTPAPSSLELLQPHPNLLPIVHSSRCLFYNILTHFVLPHVSCLSNLKTIFNASLFLLSKKDDLQISIKLGGRAHLVRTLPSKKHLFNYNICGHIIKARFMLIRA
uniref:Uncharacterized protein n=1 Tax=Cacopsylla melanoneura TaxID=428564 RepID=A0A8D8ULI2_9HEMI